ncbi:MAG: cytochrome c [Euryarchaeota archaeon]|nr:cytochrome c [Euryarchaeota archaeon]
MTSTPRVPMGLALGVLVWTAFAVAGAVAQNPEDAARGKALFEGGVAPACNSCHSTGSNRVVGPGLQGVGAKGDSYIVQSIREPSAVVVEGYPAVMPSFAMLSESQVQDLVAYLKTLSSERREAVPAAAPPQHLPTLAAGIAAAIGLTLVALIWGRKKV